MCSGHGTDATQPELDDVFHATLLSHLPEKMEDSGSRMCDSEVEFLIKNTPFGTAQAFFVHWRRRSYAGSLDLFKIICIFPNVYIFFYE